jgi:hypothetical protein
MDPPLNCVKPRMMSIIFVCSVQSCSNMSFESPSFKWRRCHIPLTHTIGRPQIKGPHIVYAYEVAVMCHDSWWLLMSCYLTRWMFNLTIRVRSHVWTWTSSLGNEMGVHAEKSCLLRAHSLKSSMFGGRFWGIIDQNHGVSKFLKFNRFTCNWRSVLPIHCMSFFNQTNTCWNVCAGKITKGHFTHETECLWLVHLKHSHWWKRRKRRSRSKFTSNYAWGTNGVCECKMDVKST